MAGRWSWDYEDDAIPPYYQIYSDDGTLFVDDCRQTDEMDLVIHSLVQAHNDVETELVQARADAATLLGLARVTRKVMEESQEDYFGAHLPLLEALRDLPQHLQDAIGYQRQEGETT